MTEFFSKGQTTHLLVLFVLLWLLPCCERKEIDSSRLSQERESCTRTADCVSPLRCVDHLCAAKVEPTAIDAAQPSGGPATNLAPPAPPAVAVPTPAPAAGSVSTPERAPATPVPAAPPQSFPECNVRDATPFDVHGEGTKAGTTRYFREGMTFSEWGSEGGSEAISFVRLDGSNLLIRTKAGSSGVVGKVRYRSTEKILKPAADGSFRFVHKGYSWGESDETMKPQQGKYRIELRGTDCIQVRLLSAIVPYEGE